MDDEQANPNNDLFGDRTNEEENMNETALIPRTREDAAIMEQVIISGDLKELSPAQRVQYYLKVCDSLGLNPYTQPFGYIVLNGKLTLYAKKDATDQIRSNRKVSVSIVSREKIDDLYIVTARATMPDGRTDESTGVVSIGNLKGDFLANACMKAETKSKRRVTLSICGLGILDETETESIIDAHHVTVTPEGEIIDALPVKPTPVIPQSAPPPPNKPPASNGHTNPVTPNAWPIIPEMHNAGDLMQWAKDNFKVAPSAVYMALGIKDTTAIGDLEKAAIQVRGYYGMKPEEATA